jgi:L-alanine-DL-glutamate epimerase-like enolase superfamily enzyme
MANLSLDGHVINKITITPVENYFGSPGKGRIVGRNAKMENYGINQREWLLQVSTDSGLTGLSNARPAMNKGSMEGLVNDFQDLIGQKLSGFFNVSGGRVTSINPRWSDLIDRYGFLDVALFDLIGQALGQPAYSLLGDKVRDKVEGYDSSLYFQDLVNPAEGANAVAIEAAEAVEKGWRAVKLKLGRPGKWFEPHAGTRRDIEVVESVRATVGDDIKILVDANNGYDGRIDLLEDFVRGIGDLNVLWMEEMVTENIADYRKLNEWRDKYTPKTMIVDGESHKGRQTIYWQLMEEGLLDAIQPDMLHMGFWQFHVLARDIEESGVDTLIAPHNYNAAYLGLRADIQFGAATSMFVIAEDSTLDFELYKGAEYVFEDGKYSVPDSPGLAVSIDQDLYDRVYKQHETVIS